MHMYNVPFFFWWKWQGHQKGWCLDISSLGQYIHIVISGYLPILLCSFDTVGVLVVICARLLSLFYLWCFCPQNNLVLETCLHNYHIDFPNNFLYVGVLQLFHCPVILDTAVKLGCWLFTILSAKNVFKSRFSAIHLMFDVCNTVGCVYIHCFALGTMQHSKMQTCF